MFESASPPRAVAAPAQASRVEHPEPDGSRRAVSSLLARMRRVGVLRHTLSLKRLRKAWELVRHAGMGVLLTQVRLHIAYRSRLADPNDDHELPPTSASPKPYEETLWPMDRPLVSVVIPCFNYGAFVREAIESVLTQTFGDMEIIVVEGGSTDGSTRQILEGLRHPRVTVLYRDKPRPAGDNRNFGISVARGKYVCCLDADDLLRPTYIEKAVFLLEHYGYDVVSTAVRRFGAVEETYGVMAAPDLTDMLQGNQVTTCAVFRRALWQRAGGYEDTPPGEVFLHEDWRFWIRLACHGARFANITGEQLFLYRAHAATSLSNAPGRLPNNEQGKLIQQAEQALITPQALAQSRQRRKACLRSVPGTRSMVRTVGGGDKTRTLLLAVPFLALGGAERLLSEVLRHLRAAGYRIVIISTLRAPPELGDTTAWFEEFTSEIYHLPRFLSDDRWPDFLEYVLAAKQVSLLWIVGSAFVYDALPDIRRAYPSLPVADLLFNTVGHTENNRRYRHYIDLNLVESAEARKWLIERDESPDRIRVVPSGVDLQRYTPHPGERQLRQQLQLEDGTFVVGCSGRLSEEKAPLSVPGIASRVPDHLPVRFIMTGTGPLEPKLREAILRQNIQQRVQFVGMVPDVRDYLACYDALVLPSTIDGRPTVVLEALAMGVPVIASAVGGLPELIQHGVTGFLCDAGDLAAFARYIVELQGNPERHRQMRDAARRFAEENLGIARMTADYARAFDDLLCAHGEQGARPGDRLEMAGLVSAGMVLDPHHEEP